MNLLAIDPGPKESAFVHYDGATIVEKGKVVNEDLLDHLAGYAERYAIELIRGYGLSVGNEVFDTCVWIGRFMQQADPRKVTLIPRKDVKAHLCGVTTAKDKDVREAIVYRFGGKDKAIGTKKEPGPLYGVAGDMWAALAVALYWSDMDRVASREGWRNVAANT